MWHLLQRYWTLIFRQGLLSPHPHYLITAYILQWSNISFNGQLHYRIFPRPSNICKLVCCAHQKLNDFNIKTPVILFFWRVALQPNAGNSSSVLRFLDQTQGTTVGSIPLDEWSASCRDLYLTTHNTHNRQIHNLSTWATADRCLRTQSHWDWLYIINGLYKYKSRSPCNGIHCVMKAWTSSSTYSITLLPSTVPGSIQQCSTRRKEGAYDTQVSL